LLGGLDLVAERAHLVGDPHRGQRAHELRRPFAIGLRSRGSLREREIERRRRW